MPSVICASALPADADVSGVLALVFTARTYVVQGMNVKELTMLAQKGVGGRFGRDFLASNRMQRSDFHRR
jgi:hypothetical protein